MAKYSTGDSGGGTGGSCELCGAADVDLETASVAGATLEVCAECASHGESHGPSGGSDDASRDDVDRRKRAAQNTARIHDAATGDSTHWEQEGTDYEGDRLPYLVADYGDRVTAARQDAGYQLEELAEELDVDPADLLALEQGRATQAGVGGSVVRTLEEFLDLSIVDED